MPVISPQGLESKSCYTCVNGPTPVMREHLVLSFYRDAYSTYDIIVEVGKMYKVKYYDASIQTFREITGLVQGISTECIAMTVTKVKDSAGNVCLCTNKDMLTGYVSSESYYVPVANISSIMEVDPNKPNTPEERSKEFVAILGISSTVIHAIIVRLKIFNDDVNHTVTSVDMEVGRSYHVVYTKNNSIFEIDGKLIKIDVISPTGNESIDYGYVRQDTNTQVVGGNNNVYDPSNYYYNLPKYNPDGDTIRLMFDTSKDFVGMSDCVMLRDIRNVVPIDSNGGFPPINPAPIYPPYPPFNPCPSPPCPPQYGCPHPPFNPFPEGPCDWPNPLQPTVDTPYKDDDFDTSSAPSWMYNPSTTGTSYSSTEQGTSISLNGIPEVPKEFNRP